MAVRRYAVLDANGVKINCILIDDPMPANYWPGYGSYLMDEGPADPKAQYTPPTISSALPVTDVTPDKPMQIGDTISLVTGKVTKFVPTIAQGSNPDGTPMVDDRGNPVMVASAPNVSPSKAPRNPTGFVRKP